MVDHADVITGAAANNPQYPLVSGWSEKGAEAVDYAQRGWTWSEKEGQYLQLETDNNGKQVNKNMVAYLLHIRTADELNISNN